jgi:hypothetical protein
MATQVQFRRGTTTQNNAFTGAIGEITYDSEAKTLRLHDGSTSGGGAVVVTLAGSQTLTNKTLSTNSVWQGTNVGLAYGGTNASLTAVAGGVVYSGGSALAISAAGTSGQVLTSAGSSAPTWTAQSSLTVGTATVATTATNIAGGSSGNLVYQVDTNDTGFIAPGTNGQVLRSTGASTTPDWVDGNVILGSTTLTLGSTVTSVAGLNTLASTGTSHWTLPAGNTSQRPGSAAAGMVRYNSEISSFEGYGPGNAWGSLGGVKDVDGDTYILTETSAGSDEDTFTFYNAGAVTATLSGTKLDVKSAVQVEVNNTTDSSSITTGALVVDGGVGIAKKLFVGTDAAVAGNTTLTGTLGVTGATTLTGALAANGGITVDTNAFTVADTTGNTAIAGTLTVTGATNLNGGLAMDTDKFTVADGTGNTAIAGTLNVTGTTTLGNLTIGSTKTISMGSNIVTNVASPSASTDAANKQYVDEVAQGLKAAPAVEVATTANLTATYSNGTAGVGATLTATSNGAFPTIDGITVDSTAVGFNGVLVKNQSTASQNGRYNLTQVGDGSNPWVLTRCGVCDQASEIPGSYVFVKAGTTQANTGWTAYVANADTFVVGTDSITYFQFSGAGTYTASTGLTLTGTAFSVNASQTQVTAVGTLTSGTWNASVIAGQYGGTGVANTGKTITIGGNFTTSGAHTTTLTTSGNTNVTLPTTGTLATIAGTETFTNKTLTSPTLTTPVLGTPSSGTLTNCTGLPVSGITASTSTAIGVGSIELGHATDTTIARSAAGVVTIEGVEVVTLSRSQTLTNKTLTSPTMTTPVLGTPSSGTLTNCTGLPNAGLVNSAVTVGSTSISLGSSATTIAGLSSVTSTSFVGALTGNASTATTLATARTISLGGDLSGSASFNGSSDVTITATIAANSVALGTDTTGAYVVDCVAGTGISLSETANNAEGNTVTITNSGVTSIVAGTGVTISGGTGAVTINASSVGSSTNLQINSLGVGTAASTNVGEILAIGGVRLTSTNPFVYNATTVSSNITIPSNYNAMAAGPITINDGVTVTVPDGSTLTIV